MRTRAWFTAVLLVLVGVLLAQSLALSSASRLAPLWALVPTAALLVVQLLVDLRPLLGERLRILQGAVLVPGAGTSGASPDVASESVSDGSRRRRELRIVLWMGGLIVLMYLVGFLVSTVLFLLPYLRIESRIGWARAAVFTAVATGVIYFAFGVLARVPFPPGVLF